MIQECKENPLPTLVLVEEYVIFRVLNLIIILQTIMSHSPIPLAFIHYPKLMSKSSGREVI